MVLLFWQAFSQEQGLDPNAFAGKLFGKLKSISEKAYSEHAKDPKIKKLGDPQINSLLLTLAKTGKASKIVISESEKPYLAAIAQGFKEEAGREYPDYAVDAKVSGGYLSFTLTKKGQASKDTKKTEKDLPKENLPPKNDFVKKENKDSGNKDKAQFVKKDSLPAGKKDSLPKTNEAPAASQTSKPPKLNIEIPPRFPRQTLSEIIFSKKFATSEPDMTKTSQNIIYEAKPKKEGKKKDLAGQKKAKGENEVGMAGKKKTSEKFVENYIEPPKGEVNWYQEGRLTWVFRGKERMTTCDIGIQIGSGNKLNAAIKEGAKEYAKIPISQLLKSAEPGDRVNFYYMKSENDSPRTDGYLGGFNIPYPKETRGKKSKKIKCSVLIDKNGYMYVDYGGRDIRPAMNKLEGKPFTAKLDPEGRYSMPDSDLQKAKTGDTGKAMPEKISISASVEARIPKKPVRAGVYEESGSAGAYAEADLNQTIGWTGKTKKVSQISNAGMVSSENISENKASTQAKTGRVKLKDGKFTKDLYYDYGQGTAVFVIGRKGSAAGQLDPLEYVRSAPKVNLYYGEPKGINPNEKDLIGSFVQNAKTIITVQNDGTIEIKSGNKAIVLDKK